MPAIVCLSHQPPGVKVRLLLVHSVPRAVNARGWSLWAAAASAQLERASGCPLRNCGRELSSALHPWGFQESCRSFRCRVNSYDAGLGLRAEGWTGLFGQCHGDLPFRTALSLPCCAPLPPGAPPRIVAAWGSDAQVLPPLSWHFDRSGNYALCHSRAVEI